jgi:hypothetical protein
MLRQAHERRDEDSWSYTRGSSFLGHAWAHMFILEATSTDDDLDSFRPRIQPAFADEEPRDRTRSYVPS